MIPIKKIFIDSKARALTSTSTSNFIIDLPETYTMPEDCSFHICFQHLNFKSNNPTPDGWGKTKPTWFGTVASMQYST